MKICVMQPAFCPPASYMRLFAASDVFVVLDDVQLNRRWYTHRQKMTDRNGKKTWLTLPIKKTNRDTTMINDMTWQDDYQEKWLQQLDKFTDVEHFPIPEGMEPLPFICSGLFNTCEKLGIPIEVRMASDISIPSDLRRQSKIIAICKALGADTYVNSPGGKDIYDAGAFVEKGIKLEFLKDWIGSYDSVIERLTDESSTKIREEIYAQI